MIVILLAHRIEWYRNYDFGNKFDLNFQGGHQTLFVNSDFPEILSLNGKCRHLTVTCGEATGRLNIKTNMGPLSILVPIELFHGKENVGRLEITLAASLDCKISTPEKTKRLNDRARLDAAIDKLVQL